MWITPDETSAVVANYVGGTLTIIHMASMSVRKTIEFVPHGTGAGPVYLLPIDGGQKLLVALINPDEIAIVDTETWTVVDTMETYGEVDGMDISTVDFGSQ